MATLVGYLIAAIVGYYHYHENKKWEEAAGSVYSYIIQKDAYTSQLERALENIINQCERVL